MGRKVTIYLNGALEYTVALDEDLEITVAATGPDGHEHKGPRYKVSEAVPKSAAATRVDKPSTPDPKATWDAADVVDPSDRA